MNIRTEAGARMAQLRKEKKLTQAELAQSLGVSQRMIAAIELGERRPSTGLAMKIGEALGMAWTEFYESMGKVSLNIYEDDLEGEADR